MGVNNLWSILSEICERKPLTYLAGKKVAVDLSGWVVQAVQCKGLNTAKSPHLRNLFFRVSRLLQLGVFPIFVTEGKPPALKETAFKERNWGHHTENSSLNNSISRSVFDRTLKQCEDLLSTLGVPCVKSSGEAEAFCAFLCLKGIVSGVITEDNDAFLYGADVIYRDFSIEPTDSHVNVYCLKSERNKLRLDQKKLVALALLLGCDYSKGVQGVGKETAVKLLCELNCDDVLERLKNWKSLSKLELFPGLVNEPLKKGAHCTRCEHLGSSSKHKKEGCSSCNSTFTCYLPKADNPCRCPWHVNNELMRKWKTELKIYSTVKNDPDFPNVEVIDEYLNFTDSIPSDEVLAWNCPNLINFQVPNCDVCTAFCWNNIYLVKNNFTLGQRIVAPGTCHIFQTTAVPILFYSLKPPKTTRRQNLYRQNSVLVSAKHFRPDNEGYYKRFFLKPHKVYKIPPGTIYVTITLQKTLFSVHMVREDLELPFHCSSPFHCDRYNPFFEQPPMTPALDRMNHDEEEQPGCIEIPRDPFVQPQIYFIQRVQPDQPTFVQQTPDQQTFVQQTPDQQTPDLCSIETDVQSPIETVPMETCAPYS